MANSIIYQSKYNDVSTHPAWDNSPVAGYRIEVDNTFLLKPLQRHIWTFRDGTSRTEEWILSVKQTNEQFEKNGWGRADL